MAAAAIFLFVLGVVEGAFARRKYLEIRPDGIVLRWTLSKNFVPCTHVQGFTWRQAPSLTASEYLWIETDQATPRRIPKDAPLRIPTVVRITRPGIPTDHLLGPLLTSPNIRTVDGREVEPLATIERAWAASSATKPPAK